MEPIRTRVAQLRVASQMLAVRLAAAPVRGASRGQGLVEYGILITLLVVAASIVIGPLGAAVTAAFQSALDIFGRH